jgi:hypothetical protein
MRHPETLMRYSINPAQPKAPFVQRAVDYIPAGVRCHLEIDAKMVIKKIWVMSFWSGDGLI